MQSEQGYVETIQAEQVLVAMKQMGWQPGAKIPGYAAIRLATGQPVVGDDQE